MNSWNMIRLLPVWIVACASGISCKPSESQAILEGRKLQNEERVLSQQKMISIADAVGRHYGRDPGGWKAAIDEGNAEWREWAVCLLYQPSYEEVNYKPTSKEEAALLAAWPKQPLTLTTEVWPKVKDDELDAAIAKRWPMLKGGDYQVLSYEDRSGEINEDMGRMIFLDKKTGKVLVVLGQWGEVIEPTSASP